MNVPPKHAPPKHAPPTFSRPLLIVAVLLAAGAAALWWVTSTLEAPPAEAPPDLMPPGRWHRISELQQRQEQERAQLLSLGYLSGKFVAPDGSGIVTWDPARAWPGVNLYTSGDGPTVRLMGLDGEELHSWTCAYRRALPDGFESGETDNIRRARLLESGDLVVLYQGGGVARLDRDSNVRWARAEPAFNDLRIGSDGRLRVISKRPIRLREVDGFAGAPDREVLEDSVAVLSLETGEVLARTSILGALARSPFRAVLDPLPSSPDILHGNTVHRLSERLHEPFSPGQLLVSLRQIDTVAVIDPESALAVWAQRGPWSRQHEPTMLPDRRLLLFDNRGAADGTSRVVVLELPVELPVELPAIPEERATEPVWSYTGIDSPEAGTARRLPNGNTLITESERGRALEVTAEGEVVWEFVSPHRAGPGGELVATLFELERYTVSDDWLAGVTGGGSAER